MTVDRRRQKGVEFFVWMHLLLAASALLYLLEVLAVGELRPYIIPGVSLVLEAAPQMPSLYVVSCLATQWRVVALPLSAPVPQRKRLYHQQYTYLALVFLWLFSASLLVGLSPKRYRRGMVAVASLGLTLIQVATGWLFYYCSKEVVARLSVMPRQMKLKPGVAAAEEELDDSLPSWRRRVSRATSWLGRPGEENSVVCHMTSRIRVTGRLMFLAYLCLGMLNLAIAVSVLSGFWLGYSFVNYSLRLLIQASVLGTVAYLYKNTITNYRRMWERHKEGLPSQSRLLSPSPTPRMPFGPQDPLSPSSRLGRPRAFSSFAHSANHSPKNCDKSSAETLPELRTPSPEYKGLSGGDIQVDRLSLQEAKQRHSQRGIEIMSESQDALPSMDNSIVPRDSESKTRRSDLPRLSQDASPEMATRRSLPHLSGGEFPPLPLVASGTRRVELPVVTDIESTPQQSRRIDLPVLTGVQTPFQHTRQLDKPSLQSGVETPSPSHRRCISLNIADIDTAAGADHVNNPIVPSQPPPPPAPTTLTTPLANWARRLAQDIQSLRGSGDNSNKASPSRSPSTRTRRIAPSPSTRTRRIADYSAVDLESVIGNEPTPPSSTPNSSSPPVRRLTPLQPELPSLHSNAETNPSPAMRSRRIMPSPGARSRRIAQVPTPVSHADLEAVGTDTPSSSSSNSPYMHTRIEMRLSGNSTAATPSPLDRSRQIGLNGDFTSHRRQPSNHHSPHQSEQNSPRGVRLPFSSRRGFGPRSSSTDENSISRNPLRVGNAVNEAQQPALSQSSDTPTPMRHSRSGSARVTIHSPGQSATNSPVLSSRRLPVQLAVKRAQTGGAAASCSLLPPEPEVADNTSTKTTHSASDTQRNMASEGLSRDTLTISRIRNKGGTRPSSPGSLAKSLPSLHAEESFVDEATILKAPAALPSLHAQESFVDMPTILKAPAAFPSLHAETTILKAPAALPSLHAEESFVEDTTLKGSHFGSTETARDENGDTLPPLSSVGSILYRSRSGLLPRTSSDARDMQLKSQSLMVLPPCPTLDRDRTPEENKTITHHYDEAVEVAALVVTGRNPQRKGTVDGNASSALALPLQVTPVESFLEANRNDATPPLDPAQQPEFTRSGTLPPAIPAPVAGCRSRSQPTLPSTRDSATPCCDHAHEAGIPQGSVSVDSIKTLASRLTVLEASDSPQRRLSANSCQSRLPASECSKLTQRHRPWCGPFRTTSSAAGTRGAKCDYVPQDDRSGNPATTHNST
eukprot:g83449.t1